MEHKTATCCQRKLHNTIGKSIPEILPQNIASLVVWRLERAVEILFQCRRTLMYTNVFAHFCSSITRGNWRMQWNYCPSTWNAISRARTWWNYGRKCKRSPDRARLKRLRQELVRVRQPTNAPICHEAFFELFSVSSSFSLNFVHMYVDMESRNRFSPPTYDFRNGDKTATNWFVPDGTWLLDFGLVSHFVGLFLLSSLSTTMMFANFVSFLPPMVFLFPSCINCS